MVKMRVVQQLVATVDAALEGRRAKAADMSPHAQIAWVEGCLPPGTDESVED